MSRVSRYPARLSRSWSSTSSEGCLEFEYEVELREGPPWGFRISGGAEYGQEIIITFIKPGNRYGTHNFRGLFKKT